MKAKKKVNYSYLKTSVNNRWDKFYAKKQVEMASTIVKILNKSKVQYHIDLPLIIAKGLIQRKK